MFTAPETIMLYYSDFLYLLHYIEQAFVSLFLVF